MYHGRTVGKNVMAKTAITRVTFVWSAVWTAITEYVDAHPTTLISKALTLYAGSQEKLKANKKAGLDRASYCLTRRIVDEKEKGLEMNVYQRIPFIVQEFLVPHVVGLPNFDGSKLWKSISADTWKTIVLLAAPSVEVQLEKSYYSQDAAKESADLSKTVVDAGAGNELQTMLATIASKASDPEAMREMIETMNAAAMAQESLKLAEAQALAEAKANAAAAIENVVKK